MYYDSLPQILLSWFSGPQPGAWKTRAREDGAQDSGRNEPGQALAAGQPGHRNVRMFFLTFVLVRFDDRYWPLFCC